MSEVKNTLDEINGRLAIIVKKLKLKDIVIEPIQKWRQKTEGTKEKLAKIIYSKLPEFSRVQRLPYLERESF